MFWISGDCYPRKDDFGKEWIERPLVALRQHTNLFRGDTFADDMTKMIFKHPWFSPSTLKCHCNVIVHTKVQLFDFRYVTNCFLQKLVFKSLFSQKCHFQIRISPHKCVLADPPFSRPLWLSYYSPGVRSIERKGVSMGGPLKIHKLPHIPIMT